LNKSVIGCPTAIDLVVR